MKRREPPIHQNKDKKPKKKHSEFKLSPVPLFHDERPQASAQRRVQSAANTSPAILQLKALQRAANQFTQDHHDPVLQRMENGNGKKSKLKKKKRKKKKEVLEEKEKPFKEKETSIEEKEKPKKEKGRKEKTIKEKAKKKYKGPMLGIPQIGELSLELATSYFKDIGPIGKQNFIYSVNVYQQLGTELPDVVEKVYKRVKKYGVVRLMEKEFQALEVFKYKYDYTASKSISRHDLFGTPTLSLYPREKDQESIKKVSLRKVAHRPILDLELINGRIYARCYLGMYRKGTKSGHKDVSADPKGKITLHNIGLMNLGNPFKAMLWCEDYLSNKEHEGSVAPSPVVRSFLVPLSDADQILDPKVQKARPLDQDRGAGQFGNYSDPNIYTKFLNPLAGSLVSFFSEYASYVEEKDKPNQTVLPMTHLQKHLTGQTGDLRDMAKKGIMAQHDRKGHQAIFSPDYMDPLTAYSESVSLENTGFKDATQESEGAKIGKFRKRRFNLSEFPKVVVKAKSGKKMGKSKEVLELEKRWQVFLLELTKLKKKKKKLPEKKLSKPKKESGRKKKKKVEPVDFSNQMVGVQIGGAVKLKRQFFSIKRNDGGGDCLFYALEGDMSLKKVLRLRALVAGIRGTQEDTEHSLNTNAHILAATLSQTFGNEEAMQMVSGLHQVPNAVLAMLQSLSGVYAGPEEIVQWCALRGQEALVIDAAHGQVVKYTAGGATVLMNIGKGKPNWERISELVGQYDHVLYKTFNHFERVTGMKKKI